jgi:hypothetical protein
MALVIAVVLVAVSAASGAASGAGGKSGVAGQLGALTRLLPPPDGKAYFGFTFRLWDTSDPVWGDSRPYAERVADSIKNELGGKRPTFMPVWATWQRPDEAGKPLVPFGNSLDDIRKVQSVTGADRVYLDWNITQTTRTNAGITTKDIAAGKLNAYIRAYARDLKSYGKPVLVRLLNGEYNGSWWYGVSPRANASLTIADFIAAWRRVVDIFRQVGARNVSWAWIVATPPPPPADWGFDRNIADYYPGDAYVDWVGADWSDLGPPDWLDPIYEFAVGHGKPFFLSEFALRHGGSVLTPSEDQAWLNAMFDYFESHPDIKAINYVNYNSRPDLGGPYDPTRLVYLYGGQVNYQANVADYDSRLLAESGADFRGTFSRRIANPRYLSSILTQHFAPPLTCLVPAVKNKPLAAAKRAIRARHCRVGHVRRAYSARVRLGRVLLQQPRAGTRMKNAGKVDLTVSRGRR